MRNSMKVAKWEYMRNVKNKSFVISLILTPVIFILFATLPTLLSDSEQASEPVTLYINDEVGVYHDIEESLERRPDMNWKLVQQEKGSLEARKQLQGMENTAYLSITSSAIQSGAIDVYTSEKIPENFLLNLHIIEQPLRALQFEQAGLTEDQMNVVRGGIEFDTVPLQQQEEGQRTTSMEQNGGVSPAIENLIPGGVAAIILFSIVITGMMIFQSASQEKKEKVAEIVLSSLTPGELMQGKIIGYFLLGITQVAVWLVFIIPIAVWRINEIPVLDFLFVPELLLLVFIAILGYLLFAAIFVGFGATVEDMDSSSNFQGMVMMLPFIPIVLIAPIIENPEGSLATIASFVPITSPAVLIMRLSMLEEWPWLEIILALVVLLISIWFTMKAAGKIFQAGILMYGKNASPKEIWKWLRA
ncbi:ABC transporter permease [Pontibacillus salicampi]|uniref:ABC transporter permease n=1 Tax=Pontibacillus salicampi TaxID=1449801 RepID=A0ABV6LQA4_9BACI